MPRNGANARISTEVASRQTLSNGLLCTEKSRPCSREGFYIFVCLLQTYEIDIRQISCRGEDLGSEAVAF